MPTTDTAGRSLPGGLAFSTDESLATALDAADPLRGYREAFDLPGGAEPPVYLLGNSLGPVPRGATEEIARLTAEWARLGVEGWSEGSPAWVDYEDSFREPLAALVGAAPDEVVTMNTLTVNLHLMLASFYRPAGRRTGVLMEEKAFPSDAYAVASHLRLRGADPGRDLILARPRTGEVALRPDDLEGLIAERGGELALVLLPGVQYYPGQRLDLARLAEAARRAGCAVGFDLAHAVGNVPLALHDWGADFAVWCSYKYLNGGPGAIGGAFVHRRHATDPELPRLAGWWGNDPASRFAMRPEFAPDAGAAGWQVSTPPLLAMAPLRASLALFESAGLAALRAKSVALTGYLEALLATLPAGSVEPLTPTDPESRGAQLSLRLPGRGRWLHQGLRDAGIVTDYREPDVARLAPAPFFNTYHEAWRVWRALRDLLARTE